MECFGDGYEIVVYVRFVWRRCQYSHSDCPAANGRMILNSASECMRKKAVLTQLEVLPGNSRGAVEKVCNNDIFFLFSG
jgi:hypothetical protein